jgi:hypothetical protein
MEKLQEQLTAQERVRESAELHAQLERAILGRARAERERDSHALLAESLQQLLQQEAPAVASKASAARASKERHHHRHCRGCRRTLPA